MPPTELPPASVDECGEPAVDLTHAHHGIIFLASYRTQGYTASPDRLLLRKGAGERLLRAADSLPLGYSLAVFDALRPAAVQQALFDEYKNRLAVMHPEWEEKQLITETRQFVALPSADPARASNHLTGGAVDLTLHYNGVPLDMGTGFDDFRPPAGTLWFEREGLTPEEQVCRDNRRLLYHLMVSQGFTNYSEEWWHFDYGNRSWARQTGCTPIYGYLPVPEQT